MDTNYDSVSGFSLRPPFFRVQKVNYKVEEISSPFLPEKSITIISERSPGSDSRQTKIFGKKRRKMAQFSQGDVVLLGYLALNLPGVARVAAEAILNSNLEPELGGSDGEEEIRGRSKPIFNN
jgi:hypothetical protein